MPARGVDGPGSSTTRAAARCCSSTCSGSSATPRSTSSRCRPSASSPTCISVHARKTIFGYRMMVWAIVAIGVLSFVVWAHHMFVSGMNPWFGFFFATTTLIIAVPTAIKVYNWTLTLWRGDIHLTVPMLFAHRLHQHLRDRRADRPLPRQRERRHPAVGHLLRGRALPHGDGRGAASWRCSAASTTGTRRSPAACSTSGSARSTSG